MALLFLGFFIVTASRLHAQKSGNYQRMLADGGIKAADLFEMTAQAMSVRDNIWLRRESQVRRCYFGLPFTGFFLPAVEK